MNIIVRDFMENDLETICELDFLLWLEIQYNQDYTKENTFTAVNEDGEVLGVASLSFHATWYAELDILHKLIYDLVVDETRLEKDLIKSKLMDRLIERYNYYKKQYPDSKICITGWCEDHDINEMQFLMSKNFLMSSVTPVLKYDLTKEILHYKIPEYIRIDEYPINDESIDGYLEATYLANEGIADSRAELRFRSGGEDFKVYTATHNGSIVSAITLWKITDERSATENIFTIPEYRRKNIAKEIIATGLQDLKDAGKKIATLSMEGTNKNAMRLYLSIGYELMYNLIEMRYEG